MGLQYAAISMQVRVAQDWKLASSRTSNHLVNHLMDGYALPGCTTNFSPISLGLGSDHATSNKYFLPLFDHPL